MRKDGLSPSRVRQAHQVLFAVLEAAVRDGRLARNVAKGVSLPRIAKSDRRYLTHSQVTALAEACGEYRLLVLVLAYTGLRCGEATALRVHNVDLLRGRLGVVEAVSDVGGRLVLGPTKTHARRSVPIPPSVREQLGEHLGSNTHSSNAGDEVMSVDPDALVFPAPSGGYLRNANWRKQCFDQAAASLGLEGLKPHELRHMAASLAIAAGDGQGRAGDARSRERDHDPRHLRPPHGR